jgi:hypothetical protein
VTSRFGARFFDSSSSLECRWYFSAQWPSTAHSPMVTHSLFAWLISHQPAVLFSQNKRATSNQPTILFSQHKSALATSHQPNEQATSRWRSGQLRPPSPRKGQDGSWWDDPGRATATGGKEPTNVLWSEDGWMDGWWRRSLPGSGKPRLGCRSLAM